MRLIWLCPARREWMLVVLYGGHWRGSMAHVFLRTLVILNSVLVVILSIAQSFVVLDLVENEMKILLRSLRWLFTLYRECQRVDSMLIIAALIKAIVA